MISEKRMKEGREGGEKAGSISMIVLKEVYSLKLGERLTFPDYVNVQ